MHTQLAGLNVRMLQASRGPPRAAVVLCHGFGAPGDDLVPLWQELVQLSAELAEVRFVFPAAPLSLGGFGVGDSRAWWMIDLALVQRLQASDPVAVQEFRRQEPAGMAAARQQLRKLVDELLIQTKLPTSRLVLGGFSQGAMLATDVALRLEEAPAGLVIMSGTLLVEDLWKPRASARAGLPVLQSHGRQDPLLAFDGAERLHDVLRSGGLLVDFIPFDGGHTITPDVLTAVADFLVARLR